MSDHSLIAFKCKKCSKIVYPKRLLCPSCRGKEFDQYPLTGEGKVITFTKLWAIPEGIEQLPLTLAIVEFDGKLRVTGQVLSEAIRTGDRVRPVWGHVRKIRGREVQGFRFEPVP
jgi:uncharacterized OB-fold protein